MFADDGCVQPNIRTYAFRAEFRPDCQHSKVRGATIDFMAESLESATRYATENFRFSKSHLARVYPVSQDTSG